MNQLNKNIKEVIQEIDFYTKKIADTDRSSTWEVEYLTDLQKVRDKIIDIVKDLVKINSKYNTDQSQNILKLARSLQNRFSRLASKYKDLREQSSTSQGGATMSAGSGAQYGAKKAFKNMYYKAGYKKVPNIKPKSYDKVELWEDASQDFQQDRINKFDTIENELNSLSPLLDNAKKYTIDYYKTNPQSLATVTSVDRIALYIEKIKQLLNTENK